jgi:hypothetical protein
VSYDTTTLTVPIGSVFTLSVRCISSAIRVCLNGVFEDVSVPLLATAGGNTSRPNIGSITNGIYSSQRYSKTLLAAISGPSLDQSAFAANPWQIFKAKAPSLQQREVATPHQSKMLGTTGQGAATAAIVGIPKRGVVSQPQGSARVDWNMGLSKGLISLFNPPSGFVSLTNLARATPTGVSQKTGKKAVGWNGGGSGKILFPSRASLLSNQVTCFALVKDIATANYSQFMNLGTDGVELRIGGALGGVQAIIRDGSQLNTPFVANDIRGIDNCPIACTYNGTTVKVYSNGATASQAAAGGPIGSLNYSTWALSSRVDGSVAANANIYFAAVWNRALSDAEIKSLSQNPYQIFQSDSSPIWVPA